jgi:group I intron endonuclease
MYIIYKITNKINGKVYIGAHKGRIDDYWGSGSVLKRAIAKYGKENFTKEVITTCESQEEMFAEERKLVTPEFIARKDTYNLRVGGAGGQRGVTGHPKGVPLTEAQKQHISESLRRAYQSGIRSNRKGQPIHSDDYKERLRKQMTGNKFCKGWQKGRPRKPVFLNKASQTASASL